MYTNNQLNNVKTYNNNHFGKEYRNRSKIVNLSKSFKSFEEGYAETIALIPEIKAYGGDNVLYEAVISSILNCINDNIPVHSNSSYPNTFSFSIDSHELGFKTDSGIAFGWRTYFDRENGEVVYRFRISFIIVHTQRRTIIQNMEKSGWTTFETARQARFWDKVENKSYNRDNRASASVDIKVDVPSEDVADIVVASSNTTKETSTNTPSEEQVTEEEERSDFINEEIAEQLKDFKPEE